MFMCGGQGGSAFGFKGGRPQLAGPSGTANGNNAQTGSGDGGAGLGNGGMGGPGNMRLGYQPDAFNSAAIRSNDQPLGIATAYSPPTITVNTANRVLISDRQKP